MLEEEMMKLSVKRSLVVPPIKATLVCSIWTKRSYSPDGVKAQLNKLRLTNSPFWVKIDPYPLEYDKKDLMRGGLHIWGTFAI